MALIVNRELLSSSKHGHYMIYTVSEYCKEFPFGGKKVSPKTVIRRCKCGMLQSNHQARKLPGKRGDWVIEVNLNIASFNMVK